MRSSEPLPDSLRAQPCEVPPSLDHADLGPVWDAVRDRLERVGLDNRGRLRLASMPSSARLTLTSLVGRTVTTTLDLALLEAGLARLGVADRLPDALGRLGYAVSDTREAARAQRRAMTQARAAARACVADGWPESWATEWIDEVIAAGLLRGMDDEDAAHHVAASRRVIDALAEDAFASTSGSRVELAARVLGDAHALDRGTRLEASITRALRRSIATDTRAVWQLAGVHGDLVSGPALMWGLGPQPNPALAALVDGATQLGAPLHLSQLMLRAAPVSVPPGTRVLVVENPRIVEAAAQRRAHRCVVATNGNPSAAVLLLLTQLQAGGAALRCHTDFDAAGLGICARLMRRGCVPWRMRENDYLDALAQARSEGVGLPSDENTAPATPWDPMLRHTFDEHRRIVHEERLIDSLLTESLES